jgi:hypothetical protein
MTGIEWKSGTPPESQRGKRLLLIASPTGGNLDEGADNRIDIYIGRVGDFGDANDDCVPARIGGMSVNKARPTLAVKYWATIDLPPNVQLRSLTIADLNG